jgi:hypothetical protein
MGHSVYIKQRWTDRPFKVTPMSHSVNLRKAESDPPSLLFDIGAFRFIADRARSDILVVVGEVSTGGNKEASAEHVSTCERIKDYLSGSADLYVQYGGLDKLFLFGYSDAAYITDCNAKSRLGGCVFMNWDSGALACYSRSDTVSSILRGFLESTISHSSTEAEINATC